VRWIPATVVGMGLGLLLGATAVGFGTTLAELAAMGALTGLDSYSNEGGHSPAERPQHSDRDSPHPAVTRTRG
jgi:hypothetical protein